MKNREICLFLIFVFSVCAASAGPSVRGVVQDRATRHTLAEANVYYAQSGAGTTSDSHGRFELPRSTLKPDTLVVRYMGYRPVRVPVGELKEDVNYIEMTRVVLVLNELRIESERYAEESIALSLEPGAQRMALKDIRTVPYTLQPDINNALQFLPGVITMNELTNELNVRGGNPDQNLVLLEDVPVYYPFHLFGLAGAFNPDLVGEVFFSPGGFSARYGNRLSSVLNVRAHSPQKPLEISSDLSMLSADLTASGRVNNKLEWILSGRRSYAEQVFKSLGEGIPYTFYDLFTKIAFTPHPKHTFSLMYFHFKDRYTDERRYDQWIYLNENKPELGHIVYYMTNRSSFYWLNTLASIKWDCRVNDRLNFSVQGYTSAAGNMFDHENKLELPGNIPEGYEEKIQQVKDEFKKERKDISNDLTDRSMQTNVNWKAKPSITLNAGALVSRFRPDYVWGSNYLPVSPLWDYSEQIGLYFDHAPNRFAYKKPVNMVNGYVEALWQPQNPLTVRGGLRFTRWQGNNKIIPEPRLNAKYQLTPNWSVTGAYGYYTQGLATALEDGLVGFLRLYFPLNDSLKQETAHHWIANVKYEAGETQISFTPFFKRYANLLRSVGPGPDFIQLPGRSYGLELFLKTNMFGWKNWFAVTVSRTYRDINGVKTDTNWDQRYRLDTYFSRSLGRGWTFSGSFVIYSGVPYYAEHYVSAIRFIPGGNITNMDQDYYDLIYIDVPPGRIRHPWYHRLDVSMEKEFHFNTWHMGFYFGIRNLYARRNVLYYEEYGSLGYNTRNGKYVDYFIKHPYKWLPPIPTVGVRVVY